MKIQIKRERAERCNHLLKAIAATGRRFFRVEDGAACLRVDRRGHVYFVEGKTRIYTHYEGGWRKFQHGGTLKNLIVAMRQYICGDRESLGGHLGPWPNWINQGDPWGYGSDMQGIRDRAKELGLV